MISFLHLFSVGTAGFTETGATAFCRWVSVVNILHENLGTICECSSSVILVLMWQFYCIDVEGESCIFDVCQSCDY